MGYVLGVRDHRAQISFFCGPRRENKKRLETLVGMFGAGLFILVKMGPLYSLLGLRNNFCGVCVQKLVKRHGYTRNDSEWTYVERYEDIDRISIRRRSMQNREFTIQD
jgi:hypothetical protein